jgi:hypothetical protein
MSMEEGTAGGDTEGVRVVVVLALMLIVLPVYLVASRKQPPSED